ncbi:MAG: metallophosphoesterase family protein [Planctomycetota bacterium]
MNARTLLLVLLAGCVVPDPHPRFTPAWESFDPKQEGLRKTRKALLVADCQLHNLYSKALPERNLAIKSVSATSIRPPQLDLFAGDVLAWILAHGGDADVVLHLGDAMDLACTGEFEAFLRVMDGGKKPWFMAPGNHDFFYFGSYDPEDRKLWEEAAYGAGEVLPKDRFIRLYVAALLKQDDPGIRALAAAVGPELPASFEWRAPEGTPGFLDAIAWKIDAERPWRSFILQDIDMTGPGEADPPVRAYLMDSCQYARRPELIPNAWKCYPLHLNCGFTGEMLPDQLRTLRKWIEGGQGGTAVLMCHHPFDSLAPSSKSSLGWLWRENRVGMMVTAHTHTGYYVHHDLHKGPERLELNLGSTTDWPMEWRTLQGYSLPDGEFYIQATRCALVEELRKEGGYFLREWEVPIDAPDDYRRYKQGEAGAGLVFDFYIAHHLTPYWMGQPRVRPNEAAHETEMSVKDTMLWTWDRLLKTFPTKPGSGPPWPPGCDSDEAVLKRIEVTASGTQTLEAKIALLKEIETFERDRHSSDPKTGEPTDAARIRYKVSQAAWASRFERAKGRRLRVEDDLIRVAPLAK